MAQTFIGTSGWTYPNWRGTFYPKDLPSARFLEFYRKRFRSTEVNSSFYHLPTAATYEKWAALVPENFIFAVKASRLMTHTKRLRGVEEPWHVFLQNARTLGSRLGPILLQFPASFRCDHLCLAKFLTMARSGDTGPNSLRLVFEFRHESWFSDNIYQLLNGYGAAVCVADSAKYPRREVITANFMYFRFHGRRRLFTSNYTKAELAEETKKMRRLLQEGYDVYAYFNNDAAGYAVANARTLAAMMGQHRNNW